MKELLMKMTDSDVGKACKALYAAGIHDDGALFRYMTDDQWRAAAVIVRMCCMTDAERERINKHV